MVTPIRAVIDTNVVFEGSTHRDGPAGVIVSAWMAELFQFLLFLLAERSRPAYSVVPAGKTAEEQRAAFARLRQKLGSASEEEVWKVLDEREPAPPEAHVGWTPELRQALEERIEASRGATSSS